MERFDVIVIGAGTAGLVAAAGAAGIGARPVLIERDRLGGECLWNGCIPSKALLACAKEAAHARHARRFGVDTDVRVDFGRAMQWVHAARTRIEPHDSPERFRGLGVEVVHGTARFTSQRVVNVDGRVLTAKRIVVASGSRPALPPIRGLESVPYLTNESIFELAELPSHLLVLGGGAIGLELAQAFVRLGSRVTVVEASTTLLPDEEPELVAMLGARLRAEGVAMHLGAKATETCRTTAGIALMLEAPHGAVSVEGSHLLVATGREARTDTMDLAKGGIATGPAGVTVDEHLSTTANGVWACGDVVGGLRFTHVADYQARLVVRNAFLPLRGKADYRAVPWVTYTDPELAHVGLTEREARARHGQHVRVFVRQFDDVDRAITDGETLGMVKLVTRANGAILGGHVLGAGAGNMIGEIALAMKHDLGVNALASLVHPYPTMPAAIRDAAKGFNKARFTGVPRSIARWFARR
jgi:pyruvate/2-oxoglutarate dehydrogenase complex dihydrolipoamide dehydrogenase (E3) component